MASLSTLPGPALQASKAALSAALAEIPVKDRNDQTDDNADEYLEPGEIQEVDMQAQAENIRTVFNDPQNFNVKVSFSLPRIPVASLCRLVQTSFHNSTPSSLPGLCGLIPPPPRAETFLKLPCPPFRKLPFHKLPVASTPLLKVGWKTLSV